MKNTLIVILSLLVIGLLCYIVIDKTQNNIVNCNIPVDNEIDMSEINNNVEKDYNLSESRKLIDTYTSKLNLQFDDIKNSGLSQEIKLSMTITNLEPDKDGTCADAFDEEDQRYFNRKFAWGCITASKVYSYEMVNEKYKELFGSQSNAPRINPSYRRLPI